MSSTAATVAHLDEPLASTGAAGGGSGGAARAGKGPAPRVAGLIERGLVKRGTRGLVGRGRGAAAGGDEVGAERVLPLRDELRPLLPGRGLRRGAVIAVAAEHGSPDRLGAAAATPNRSGFTGPAGSTTLLLALISEAVRAGSWCAVVGVPELGACAAAELGVELSRLVLAPYPWEHWTKVTAALLDGLDVVAVKPSSPVSAKQAQQLAARAKQRGGVLIPYGGWAGADITVEATDQIWHGLARGSGRLRDRELAVTSYGRGFATRPRHARMWLPAPGSLTPEAPWSVRPVSDIPASANADLSQTASQAAMADFMHEAV